MLEVVKNERSSAEPSRLLHAYVTNYWIFTIRGLLPLKDPTLGVPWRTLVTVTWAEEPSATVTGRAEVAELLSEAVPPFDKLTVDPENVTYTVASPPLQTTRV